MDGVDNVPILYGFVDTGVEYGEAWGELFRYTRSCSPGGCSTAEGRPKMEAVKYCTSCREAERKWVEEHVGDSSDDQF